MPWSNQGGGGWQGGGGGGGGRGPWGQGPRGGGGGQRPPDLEELLRRGQDRFKGMFPGGSGGGMSGRAIGLIAAFVLVGLWLYASAYRVNADEQGVVLRFGAYAYTTQPGLRFAPWPVETVIKPQVTRVNREEIGFRSGGDASRQGGVRDIADESLMVTGDQNIVDIDFAVLWVIRDAGEFLFNVENPAMTIKLAAESAMREVIGKNNIQRILTEGRGPIEQSTRDLLQRMLDSYGAGVSIQQVSLQKVDPPSQVIEAFRDVQAAQADRERAQNEAEAYRNDIIPRARGEAQRLAQQAEAYKQEVTANAQGEAARFVSVYNEYRQARDVTARRMYLETMEQVLRGTNKVIVDKQEGGGGVVPYLPLQELQRARPPQAHQPTGAAR
jgi:membrane protease subunit HflK